MDKDFKLQPEDVPNLSHAEFILALVYSTDGRTKLGRAIAKELQVRKTDPEYKKLAERLSVRPQ
jgi:hypothetical protein